MILQLKRLRLSPPLAFARVGPSPTPCPAFTWAPNDVRPRGTGKTTLVPAETLELGADGTISSAVPEKLHFKDEAGFRPVCPFFELHGEWSRDGTEERGAITLEVLKAAGIGLADLSWSVHVANLKAHHYTLSSGDGDRVEARVDLRGDRTDRAQLQGRSPEGSQPLVSPGHFLPLGYVQLSRPTESFPELRLRFTPAVGAVYGPADLPGRIQALNNRYPAEQRERHWVDFELPAERLILNPNAAWCRFALDPDAADDLRTNPESLYAWEDVEGEPQRSLGLIDDVCDGIVSCTVAGVPKAAVARIVVTPPTFAPDRRPFVSLADDLKDRVDRYEVLDEPYVKDRDQVTMEIRDLMERVLETVGLTNLDFQNERSGGENREIAGRSHQLSDRRARRPFPDLDLIGHDALPLTARGRERHRRFISLEVFEAVLRERPDLLDLYVREPLASDPYYDTRMPAMVRGSDGQPMHLTRRQYTLLKAWVKRLRRDVEGQT